MGFFREAVIVYQDREGNEITKEEYELLQGIVSPKEEIDNDHKESADRDLG